MSLDGFVAGPSQSVENPLGIGGMRLHEWALPLVAWRALHGLEGGEVNASTPVVEESLANIGATVMGRNMFGGHPGPWDARKPWNGWWGVNPPFHHPVFVLTHHAREPLAQLRRVAPVSRQQTALAQLDEVLEGVAPVGRREGGQEDSPQVHLDRTALGDLEGAAHGLLRARKEPRHLFGRVEVELVALEAPALRVRERVA